MIYVSAILQRHNLFFFCKCFYLHHGIIYVIHVFERENHLFLYALINGTMTMFVSLYVLYNSFYNKPSASEVYEVGDIVTI